MNPYNRTLTPAAAALFVLRSLQNASVAAVIAVVSAAVFQMARGVEPTMTGGLIVAGGLSAFFSFGSSARKLEAVMSDAEKSITNQPAR